MASGIFMRFRRAPLHQCSVFYLAQRFWHLWFIAFLLGFSLPPFPPGSVIFLCYGVRVRVCALSYLLFFH